MLGVKHTGGISTDDATATAADLLTGKTAYAKGQKITGTLPNVQIDGAPPAHALTLSKTTVNELKLEGCVPGNYGNNTIILYHGELHALGAESGYTGHYKWTGKQWVKVSTLPYSFYIGAATVYKDEIHVLGSFNDNGKRKHYKWTGSQWVSASTLPGDVSYRPFATEFKNELHLITGSDHRKWNGSTWSKASTMPYSFYESMGVVYNGAIHIMGGSGSERYSKHYKWDGISWAEAGALPSIYDSDGKAVVCNNEIHLLGDAHGGGYHYKGDGTTWTKMKDFSGAISSKSAVVYKDKIHIINEGSHCILDETIYRE